MKLFGKILANIIFIATLVGYYHHDEPIVSYSGMIIFGIIYAGYLLTYTMDIKSNCE